MSCARLMPMARARGRGSAPIDLTTHEARAYSSRKRIEGEAVTVSLGIFDCQRVVEPLDLYSATRRSDERGGACRSTGAEVALVERWRTSARARTPLRQAQGRLLRRRSGQAASATSGSVSPLAWEPQPAWPCRLAWRLSRAWGSAQACLYRLLFVPTSPARSGRGRHSEALRF